MSTDEILSILIDVKTSQTIDSDECRFLVAKLRAAEELNKLCHELMEIDDESSKEFESKILEIQKANWVYVRAGKGEG